MNTLSVHPVLDFWKFLRRPIAEYLSASLTRKLIIVLMIVALDILISLGTGPLTDLMIEVSQFDEQAVVEEFTPRVLLTGVLLVPLIEEVFSGSVWRRTFSSSSSLFFQPPFSMPRFRPIFLTNLG